MKGRIEIGRAGDEPRSLGRPLMSDHNLSARLWATGALLAAPLASLQNLGWWLPLHMALLGAVTQAIVGGQLMFSATLGLSRGPNRAVTITQLGLLNIAALLVITGRLIAEETVLAAGAGLFVAVIGWVTWLVRGTWRRSVNRRNGTLFAGSTKTGVKRTVSIPRDLCQMLGEHLTTFPSSGGFVFTSAKGKPLRRNFYKRHYLPALVRSGLDPQLCLCQKEDCEERHTPLYRFHDLRHTCAALLIAQGAHPKEIQEQLGHSTIRITLDRYGHLFPSLHERLSDGLNEVFKSARTAVQPATSTDAVPMADRKRNERK